jgi:hypothetical protein
MANTSSLTMGNHIAARAYAERLRAAGVFDEMDSKSRKKQWARLRSIAVFSVPFWYFQFRSDGRA